MKILASPSSFGQIDSRPLDILKDKGFTLIPNQYGRKLSEDETIDLANECIGIVAGIEIYNKNVIDKLSNLQCISRVGVGLDNIDLDYAKSKGIKVINTPNGPTRAVAELTLGLTFSMLRKIHIAHLNLKNRVWEKQIGNLLYKKKIGILGLGRIGKMVAEMFRSLNNPVFGYDLYPDYEWADNNNVKVSSFDEVLSKSDIISIHIPGNSDGKPIIDHKEFSKIKNGSFLVNISRGGVVNEDSLYENLNNGKLSAAAIDVFNNEPYNGQLCDLDNVILTPHIGSYAREGKIKMEIDAVMNLINELK